MTNKPELKPCPFCGGEPEFYPNYIEGEENFVECSNAKCQATNGYVRRTPEEALSAWNTRAELAALSSDEVEEAFYYITPPPENHSFISFSANNLRGYVSTLRAHIYKLEDQVKQQQWQPIETAPKDGTYIFATDVGNHPISKEPWVGDACYWNGRSFDNDSDSLDERDWWKPTLWMPMPPPPHKDTCVVCGHVHVGLACPTLSVISTRE